MAKTRKHHSTMNREGYMGKERSEKHREGHYETMSARRRQEDIDGAMIGNDYNCMANMPQSVKREYYPREYGYTPEDLDDTIRGVDKQMGVDNRKKMEQFMPKKV